MTSFDNPYFKLTIETGIGWEQVILVWRNHEGLQTRRWAFSIHPGAGKKTEELYHWKASLGMATVLRKLLEDAEKGLLLPL